MVCKPIRQSSNTTAHYESTGPEIWEQTEGKIPFYSWCRYWRDNSGVGKYLKENPDIKIWGIDTYGSVFKKYHETGVLTKTKSTLHNGRN
jgi:cystathionine beta-synthase